MHADEADPSRRAMWEESFRRIATDYRCPFMIENVRGTNRASRTVPVVPSLPTSPIYFRTLEELNRDFTGSGNQPRGSTEDFLRGYPGPTPFSYGYFIDPPISDRRGNAAARAVDANRAPGHGRSTSRHQGGAAS